MHLKKMIVKIIVDILLIIIGLFFITVIRALFPVHLPNKYTPKNFGIDYEEIEFSAIDGKNLSGWLIYSPTAKGTIICCHGYPANKSDIFPSVSFLYPQFNLFLFDFRGHGDSDGRLVTFGFREDRDILGAINYIQKNPQINNLPIGIWGYSFGAAVAIKVCAQNKQKHSLIDGQIKALVTDSTYASFPEMIIQHYENLGPFKYLFASMGKLFGNILFKGRLSQLSPESLINSSNVPILIIHASGDPFVPVEHARRLYKKANQQKELLIISDTAHGVSTATEYKNEVTTFFKKHLLEK